MYKAGRLNIILKKICTLKSLVFLKWQGTDVFINVSAQNSLIFNKCNKCSLNLILTY